MWHPSSEEMMKALLMVLTDTGIEAPTECLFWHGSPTNSRSHDRYAARSIAKFYRAGGTDNIVVNGMDGKTCKERNLCYPGHEMFIGELRSLGVAAEDITMIPPSNHTAAESENLLRMCLQRNWKSVTITSAPHHQLRCFLQIIASMTKLGIRVDAYNRTFYEVDWREPLKKPLLDGGEIDGMLVDHVQAEHDRIVKYANADGVQFTKNATIPEMFDYLKTRE